jgi:hypothetical protein
MNRDALKQLNQFTGTSQYYTQGGLLGKFVYTDGVKHLAANADAYWLLVAIASHQPDAQRDPKLQQMQFWTLRKEANGATLICERDSDDVAITQQIPYTDFPFDVVGEKFSIWVAPTQMNDGINYVAYLPSEH